MAVWQQCLDHCMLAVVSEDTTMLLHTRYNCRALATLLAKSEVR